MINYDGYGFVLCMMCPTSCPSPSQLHLTAPYPTTLYCHLTTNTQQHHYHYHTTPHQGSDANNTSTISTLGDFSLSQNGQPILAQPNFHTLYQSGQCSPKHEFFQICWCHMIDQTFSHPYILKISRKCCIFFIWQTIQKCQLFPPLLSIWRKSFFTLWTKRVSVRPSVNEN